MLIENIDQICLKMHSSDLNLHMFACRVLMWWGGALFWHMERVFTTWAQLFRCFQRKKTKVSLYPKLWYLRGINTISKSRVFNCIGGEGEFVLHCKIFLYDVISTEVARTLCEEAQWLDLHVDNCKHGPKMCSFKMNMFKWRQNIYKVKSKAFGRYNMCNFFTFDIFIWIIVNPLYS